MSKETKKGELSEQELDQVAGGKAAEAKKVEPPAVARASTAVSQPKTTGQQ